MMSKLLKLSFFALVCVTMLSFVTLSSHVEASLPSVTARISSRFGDSNTGPDLESNLDYGTRVEFVPPSPGSPYEFAFWSVNGFLRPDLPVNHQFLVNSRMELEAIFRPSTGSAIVYLDSNGFILHVDFTDGEVLDPIAETTITAPNRSGLTVLSGPGRWEVLNGNSIGQTATQDTVLRLNYESVVTTFTISGNSESLFNLTAGEALVSNEAPFNAVIRATAPDLPGEFSHWEEDGVVISFNEEYYFTALYNRTINAVFKVDPDTPTAVATLSPRLSLESGTFTYVGQLSLPDSYELVEFGFLLTNDQVSNLLFDSTTVLFDPSLGFNLTGSGIHTLSVPSESIQVLTREFVATFAIGSHNTVRAFATYFDEHDNVQTVLSEVLVLAPLTIEQALAKTSGQYLVKGIVTSIDGVTATIQDDTNAIHANLFSSGLSSFFVVGNEVELTGTRDYLNGLERFETITSAIVLSSGNSLPPKITLDLPADFALIEESISQIADVVGLSFVSATRSGSGLNATLTDGVNFITLRVADSTTNSSQLQMVLENAVEGQSITLTNVVISVFSDVVRFQALLSTDLDLTFDNVEDFSGFSSSSYADSTPYTGLNGIIWNHNQVNTSRSPLNMHTSANSSWMETEIEQGISQLQIRFAQSFSGSSQIRVILRDSNGIETSFDSVSTSGTAGDSKLLVVKDIDIPGTFTLRIETLGAQTTISDVSWNGFDGPIITGVTNSAINVGDSFDPLAGVSATKSASDGTPLTVNVELRDADNVVIPSTEFDSLTAGAYTVIYSATNSLNNLTTTVVSVLTVVNPSIETIVVSFGTSGSSGYNVSDNGDGTFGRFLTFSEIEFNFYNAQTATSANSPHEGMGAFAVLGIGRGGNPAYIQFDFEGLSEISFDVSWWSSADSSNLSAIQVLAFQRWDASTSSWVTVYDFKTDLDASKYTTISVSVTQGETFRFFGSANITSNNIRVTLDNIELTRPLVD